MITGSLQADTYGNASYYGWDFAGKLTASGDTFNPMDLTAAHPSLPFGTEVKVTNLKNGKSVTVTINDRGPYIEDRIIDLSRRAAEIIEMKKQGVALVKLEVVDGTEKG